jgi:hypothetical protein
MLTKTRNELPTRSRNIPPPSDYLEAKSAKIDTEIAESSRKLLKAQLATGHHKLTRESFVGIAKKYDWQFALHATLPGAKAIWRVAMRFPPLFLHNMKKTLFFCKIRFYKRASSTGAMPRQYGEVI